MRCEHPVHRLGADELAMLDTAVKTLQAALWGDHPPTVFGNNPVALRVANKLADRFEEGQPTHHAKDGCWHIHYPPRAAIWHHHYRTCGDNYDDQR